MTEGSETERFSTWIANWQVTVRKNETGLSPVVWNINYLFGNFYVGQVTHLTTPRSAPVTTYRPHVITEQDVSKNKCSSLRTLENDIPLDDLLD